MLVRPLVQSTFRSRVFIAMGEAGELPAPPPTIVACLPMGGVVCSLLRRILKDPRRMHTLYWKNRL